ncbi:uncharacterized protein VTP21DRAFT_6988 [Calcarisporiella thermophila]|uniref:uncharacterized protein n=1 Tax=Calcarisporiella thermophila TaxID=911321 RepID=UPI0037421EC1
MTIEEIVPECKKSSGYPNSNISSLGNSKVLVDVVGDSRSIKFDSMAELDSMPSTPPSVMQYSSDVASQTRSAARGRSRGRGRGRSRTRGNRIPSGAPGLDNSSMNDDPYTYDCSGDGALAGSQGATRLEDGKPREERSYKEFFPDLDLTIPLQIVRLYEEPEASEDTPASASISISVEPTEKNNANTPAENSSGTPALITRRDSSTSNYELSKSLRRSDEEEEGVDEEVKSLNGYASAEVSEHSDQLMPTSKALSTNNATTAIATADTSERNSPVPTSTATGTPWAITPMSELDAPALTPVTSMRQNLKLVHRPMAENPFQALSTRARPAPPGTNSDRFRLVTKIPVEELPKPTYMRISEPLITQEELEELEPFRRPDLHYIRYSEPSEGDLFDRVEYDMDEQDERWLVILNAERRREGLKEVSADLFEAIMDKLEKEWFDLVKNIPKRTNKDSNSPEDSACAICDDSECENSNAIVFCDGCNLAVHQDCYGIPYIPEGQWLCRKCMISPDKPVSCIFCPNEGGAFKQTNTNRWAHLLCAIWIPEVGLANPVYMEPVDNIEKIPKSRWKLKCYICKKRMGACIQCDHKFCFAAYHVMCGRRAKLYMKMKAAGSHYDGGILRSYCDRHTPKEYKEQVDVSAVVAALQAEWSGNRRVFTSGEYESSEGEYRPSSEEEDENDVDEDDEDEDEYSDSPVTNKKRPVAKRTPKYKSRKTKKSKQPYAIQNNKAARAHQHSYTTNLFLVPAYICNRLLQMDFMKPHLQKKPQMLMAVCRYWSLKRESRRGAPLLKRLHLEPWTASSTHRQSEAERNKKLACMQILRKDLERIRMLAESVKRREKQKLQRCILQKKYLELILFPLDHVLGEALTELQAVDKQDMFAGPVSIEEVPDYLDIVTNPMDFATMRFKLESHSYSSIEEFNADAQLVIDNCKLYNRPDTPFYKAALRLQKALGPIIEKAREDYKALDVEQETGILNIHIHPELFTYNALPLEPEKNNEDNVGARAGDEVKPEKEVTASKENADEETKTPLRRSKRGKASPNEVLKIIPAKGNQAKPPDVTPRRITRNSAIQELETANLEETLDQSPGFRRPIRKSQRLSSSGEGLSNSPLRPADKKRKREEKEPEEDDNKRLPRGWIYVTDDEGEESQEKVQGTEEEKRGEGIALDTQGRSLRRRPSSTTQPQTTSPAAKEPSKSAVTPNQRPNKLRKVEDVKKEESMLPVGSIVWAKVAGFPPHPARINDPSDPKIPKVVLAARRPNDVYVVRFFQAGKQNEWAWMPINHVYPLGVPEIDHAKLHSGSTSSSSSKRLSVSKRAEIRSAYEAACKAKGIKPVA